MTTVAALCIGQGATLAAIILSPVIVWPAIAAWRGAGGRRPLPAPRPAGGAPLTEVERGHLAELAAWLGSRGAPAGIAAEGSRLADQLRIALPDVADADISRVLVGLLDEAAFNDNACPDAARAYDRLTDAMAAAAVNLTALERIGAL